MLDLNFDKLATGEQVRTIKNYLWTHIGKDSWRDDKSGLVWMADLKGEFNYQQALEMQQKDLSRLPTKDEYVIAEQHGIREVIFNMRACRRWCSTPHETIPNFAYGFNSYGGVVFYGLTEDSFGFLRMVADAVA